MNSSSGQFEYADAALYLLELYNQFVDAALAQGGLASGDSSSTVTVSTLLEKARLLAQIPEDVVQRNLLAGYRGVSGPVGKTGERGDKGEKGDPGIQGEQGLKGDTGATGATGAGVPTGGQTGWILQKKTDTDFDTTWAPSSAVLPAGGTGGQVLAKRSATDFDYAWTTPTSMTGLPTGGLAGQILVKNSTSDFDAAWITLPTGTGGSATNGLPAGGAAGQVLVKSAGSDYAATWQPAPAPAVGYAEQLRAGHVVTGGGTVVWSTGYTLAWSGRFVVAAAGTGAAFATGGSFEIVIPANGTVLTALGGAQPVTVTNGAVYLAPWTALYYILPVGASQTSRPENFRVVGTSATAVDVPESWVCVAVHNGDNHKVRLACGASLYPGTTFQGDNDLVAQSSNAGAPALAAVGSAADVDLLLVPKGKGRVGLSGAPLGNLAQTYTDLGAKVGAVAVNLQWNTAFKVTVAGAITWTFLPIGTPQALERFKLILVNGGTAAMTWPSSVRWTGGSAPTLSTASVDILEFMTVDAGATWYAAPTWLGMNAAPVIAPITLSGAPSLPRPVLAGAGTVGAAPAGLAPDWTMFGTRRYYVSPAGSDTTGTGAQGAPWKTLAYAAGQVNAMSPSAATPYAIVLMPGTHAVTATVALNPGVSVLGQYLNADGTYAVTVDATASAAGTVLDLTSAGHVTGNQNLGWFRLLGAYTNTAGIGIAAQGRDQVRVLQAAFSNFYVNAIRITGPASWTNALPVGAVPADPPYTVTGCQIHDCVITRCGNQTATTLLPVSGATNVYAGAALSLATAAVDVARVTVDNSAAASGAAGCVLSWPGFLTGSTFTDCTFTVNNTVLTPAGDLLSPVLAFCAQDDTTFLRCKLVGGYNAVRASRKHNGTWGVVFKSCEFTGQTSATQPTAAGHELSGSDVLVDSCYVHDTMGLAQWSGLYGWSRNGDANWAVRYSVFENCWGPANFAINVGGMVESATGQTISQNGNWAVSGIYLDSNTFVGSSGVRVTLYTNDGGPIYPINALRLTNSIFSGCGTAIDLSGSSLVNNTVVGINDYYNCTTTLTGQSGTTNSAVASGSLTANPLFVAGASGKPSPYYTLQTGSPCLAKGTSYGLPGQPATPALGAYDPNFGASTGTFYTISVTQGASGTISPASASVAQGGSQVFTIAANAGYAVNAVVVDGTSVGAVGTYTFVNVTAAHTITASFRQVSSTTLHGSNMKGAGGTPSGNYADAPATPTLTPTHYVATTGSNSTGTGTQAKPWATPSYAASKATTSGMVIAVAAGTYTDNAQVGLAQGVSLVGAGMDQTIINTSYAGDSYIKAYDSVDDRGAACDGNQTIGYLTINCHDVTAAGIYANGRNNVHVEQACIHNAHQFGVRIAGLDGWDGAGASGTDANQPPPFWASGCWVKNCYFYHNGHRSEWDSNGNATQESSTLGDSSDINFQALSGFLIYNCYMDESAATPDGRGDSCPMKSWCGFNSHLVVDSVTALINPKCFSPFCFEIAQFMNGSVIQNCTFHGGGTSIIGTYINDSSTYGLSCKNVWFDFELATGAGHEVSGNKVEFDSCYFTGGQGLGMWTTWYTTPKGLNTTVHNCVFENITETSVFNMTTSAEALQETGCTYVVNASHNTFIGCPTIASKNTWPRPTPQDPNVWADVTATGTFTYNIMSNSGTAPAGILTCSNNFAGDPAFAASGDKPYPYYSLNASSPAAGKGAY